MAPGRWAVRVDKDGVFSLKDVPAGTYTVVAWHKTAGKFRKTVQGISEETRRLLQNYDWPGNVRELKNALERAMILEDGNLLRPDDLPFSVASGRSNAIVDNNHSGASAETPAVPGKRRLLPTKDLLRQGRVLRQVKPVQPDLAQGHRAGRILRLSRSCHDK